MHPIYKSRHSLSIRWLCTLLPAMWLPRFGPLKGCDSTNHATSQSSLPISDLTLEGSPKVCTAFWNRPYTQWKHGCLCYIAKTQSFWWNHPFLHPCITNLNLKKSYYINNHIDFLSYTHTFQGLDISKKIITNIHIIPKWEIL